MDFLVEFFVDCWNRTRCKYGIYLHPGKINMTRETQPFEDVISEKTRDFLLSRLFSNVFSLATYIFPPKIPSFCWQTMPARRCSWHENLSFAYVKEAGDTPRPKCLAGNAAASQSDSLVLQLQAWTCSIPGNPCPISWVFPTTWPSNAQLGIGRHALSVWLTGIYKLNMVPLGRIAQEAYPSGHHYILRHTGQIGPGQTEFGQTLHPVAQDAPTPRWCNSELQVTLGCFEKRSLMKRRSSQLHPTSCWNKLTSKRQVWLGLLFLCKKIESTK